MRTTKFDELRAEVDARPDRRARVNQMKRAMRDAVRLAQLRESRQVRQSEMGTRIGVSQARVSQIEHGEDLYLSTLSSYVEALGGELHLTAVFDDGTVDLSVPSGSESE